MTRERPDGLDDDALEDLFAQYLEHLDGGGDPEVFLSAHPDQASDLLGIVEFQDSIAFDLAPPSQDAMERARQQLHASLRRKRLKRMVRFPFRRPRLWVVAGSLGIGLSFGAAFAQDAGRVVHPFSSVVNHLPPLISTGAPGPDAFDEQVALMPTPATPSLQPPATVAIQEPPAKEPSVTPEATQPPKPTPAAGPTRSLPLANTGAEEHGEASGAEEPAPLPMDGASPEATPPPAQDPRQAPAATATATDGHPGRTPAPSPGTQVPGPATSPTQTQTPAVPTPTPDAPTATPAVPTVEPATPTPEPTVVTPTPTPIQKEHLTPVPTGTVGYGECPDEPPGEETPLPGDDGTDPGEVRLLQPLGGRGTIACSEVPETETPTVTPTPTATGQPDGLTPQTPGPDEESGTEGEDDEDPGIKATPDGSVPVTPEPTPGKDDVPVTPESTPGKDEETPDLPPPADEGGDEQNDPPPADDKPAPPVDVPPPELGEDGTKPAPPVDVPPPVPAEDGTKPSPLDTPVDAGNDSPIEDPGASAVLLASAEETGDETAGPTAQEQPSQGPDPPT